MSIDISLVFKGRTEKLTVNATDNTDTIFELARDTFDLHEQNIKILAKGKQLAAGTGTIVGASLVGGAKCMVMATGKRDVEAVKVARSDPTVRGFASEDAEAKRHLEMTNPQSQELSVWGVEQHAEYKFCRFEACTWQSFGTRPSSTTPHAFEARGLLLKLAQDPAVCRIMVEREWTVGLLAEMDPIDDRLAEKKEQEGKCLLGYNSNHGASIYVRLRTGDLSGFMTYPALVDTLLHELSHNMFGAHDDNFWHLFCQLKSDYLRHIGAISARGELFGGKSALQLACVSSAELHDVRATVLAALERDRQVPTGPLQPRLLDEYLRAVDLMEGGAAGRIVGGVGVGGVGGGGGGGGVVISQEERRTLLAERASARLAGSAAPSAVAAGLGPDGLASSVGSVLCKCGRWHKADAMRVCPYVKAARPDAEGLAPEPLEELANGETGVRMDDGEVEDGEEPPAPLDIS